MSPRKVIQATFSRSQTACGKSNSPPSISSRRFLPTRRLTQNDTASAQYAMLGFHLMITGLWNQMVAPPSTSTSASVIHSIRCTGRRVSLSTATWTSVMTLITTVPSSTGASSVPTTPPDTMKPTAPVATAAAHSLWRSAYWKVPKKRIRGRKSRNSFIGSARRSGRGGSLLVSLEVYRRRIDAEALPGGRRPILEDMAQVRAALVAADLDAHHPVALVDHALDDLAVDRLPVAGPAAARIELGVGREQRRAASHAVVLSGVPVVPVLAGEGPLGGRVARDLVLRRIE